MKISAESIKVSNGQDVITEVCNAVANGDCVIDFSNVKSVDSTVVAVIFAARREQKVDNALELQHLPTQLHGLIEAYGVQSLF